MNLALFSTGDVAKLTDVPPRRLLILAEKGILTSDIQGVGTGNKRRYSTEDVMMVLLCQRLISVGVQPTQMGIIVSLARLALKEGERSVKIPLPFDVTDFNCARMCESISYPQGGSTHEAKALYNRTNYPHPSPRR